MPPREAVVSDVPDVPPADVLQACGPAAVLGTLRLFRNSTDVSGPEVDLPFAAADVRLHARRAPGTPEDGCIGAVDVALTNADGCRLRVVTVRNPVDDGETASGGLPVDQAVLTVGGTCAALLGVPAGDYVAEELKTRRVVVSPRRIPDTAAAPACADVAVTAIRLYGQLRALGGGVGIGVDSSSLELSTPRIEGSFPFDLSEDLACPFLCGCEGKMCGDDGCGGSCGTCKACDGSDTAACDAGTCPVLCCPACGDRVCGDDGCGGTCGTCGDGLLCDPSNGACVTPCAEPLNAWGPAGVLAAAATPSPRATAQAVCFDYTGDGLGENGLAFYSQQMDGMLAGLLGRVVVALDAGVTDLSGDGSFELWMTPIQPAPSGPSGEVLADPSWTSPIDCRPAIRMAAERKDGALTARAGRVEVPVQLRGLSRRWMPLEDLRLKGTMVPGGGPGGFELTDGVFGFLFRSKDYEIAADAWRAECTALPKEQRPEDCAYLFVTGEGSPFDLACAADGTCQPRSYTWAGNTASLCFTFGLTPAKVVGFVP